MDFITAGGAALDSQSILDWALAYWRLGWSIIPIDLRGERKKPATAWKPFQTRPASDGALIEWFGDGKASGLGVVFGDVSGNLASRDFDCLESYKEWARRYASLAKVLPTVETRRGRHVYAKLDPASVVEFRQRIGKPHGKGAIDLGDGELRVGHCYSVVPPSVRSDGFAYRWLSDCKLDALPTLNFEETGFGCCYIESAESAGEPRGLKTCISPEVASEALAESVAQLLANSDGGAPAWSAWTGEAEAAPRCGPGSPGWRKLTLHEQIEAAIAATIPTGHGMRHRAIFEFGRWLKAIPEFAGRPAPELLPILCQWHERARSIIRTKPYEETKLDFLESWDKIENPKGQERIRMSFDLALKADLPKCAQEYESDQIKLLIGFCRELQRAAGDKPFYLACSAAAPLLETTNMQVNRWLRLLCLDKVLRLVEKGERGKRRASTFRYLHPL